MRRYILSAGLLALVLAPSQASAAEMDEVCVQRLAGAQEKRLQHCSAKFQGEHRELCEAAARQEHEKTVQMCRSKDAAAVPGVR